MGCCGKKKNRRVIRRVKAVKLKKHTLIMNGGISVKGFSVSDKKEVHES